MAQWSVLLMGTQCHLLFTERSAYGDASLLWMGSLYICQFCISKCRSIFKWHMVSYFYIWIQKYSNFTALSTNYLFWLLNMNVELHMQKLFCYINLMNQSPWQKVIGLESFPTFKITFLWNRFSDANAPALHIKSPSARQKYLPSIVVEGRAASSDVCDSACPPFLSSPPPCLWFGLFGGREAGCPVWRTTAGDGSARVCDRGEVRDFDLCDHSFFLLLFIFFLHRWAQAGRSRSRSRSRARAAPVRYSWLQKHQLMRVLPKASPAARQSSRKTHTYELQTTEWRRIQNDAVFTWMLYKDLSQQ